MAFTCPICKEESIAVLTKFLTFEMKRPNRFECTACGAKLRCHYSPMLFFMCGIVLHILLMMLTGMSSTIGSFGFTALAFMIAMLFVIPIRADSRNARRAIAPKQPSQAALDADANTKLDTAPAPEREFVSPSDQALYALESKILSIAVWLTVTMITVRIMRSNIQGDVGFGGVGLLLLAAIIGVIGASLYVFVVYQSRRSNKTLRYFLDVAAIVSVFVVFML